MIARKLRLFHRLQVAAHRSQIAADRLIGAEVSVTTAQAGVLSVLSNAEGCTQKEIAIALGHNESAITPMVARLLRRGFVHRRKSETDRRAWILSISSKGKEALQQTRKPFDRMNRAMEKALSPKEIENLADYLSRLSSAFDNVD